jgi:hypothetical protein
MKEEGVAGLEIAQTSAVQRGLMAPPTQKNTSHPGGIRATLAKAKIHVGQ